jgi:hypothetical protein
VRVAGRQRQGERHTARSNAIPWRINLSIKPTLYEF